MRCGSWRTSAQSGLSPYRSYLAALQLQYDTTRAGMDKESRRQARLAARALVRRHTRNGFAPDVMPLELTSSVVPSNEVVTKLSCGDGTMTLRLSLTFSRFEIVGSVDALSRRDEALRSV
jgi:hypothetical protein